MNPRQAIVAIGNSVRYLAQSARAAGVSVTAIDAFGDADTCQASADCRRASGPSPQHLSQTARPVLSDARLAWTYGAGFEQDPDALRALGPSDRGLVGNDPAVLGLLAEPARWFALLADLDIACPQTALEPSAAGRDWLVKPAGGCGGSGVHRFVHPDPGDAAVYYQRFVGGPLCSLVFVADGARMQPLGFNRLFARYPAAGDFRFAGAISGLVPAEPARRCMLTAAQRLTRALGLRGVNGIDFALNQGQPLLLDLNARPTATLELYEDDLPAGGYLCHVDGCEGVLTRPRSGGPARGMHIVTARRPSRLGPLSWPSWVSDRPVAGEFVPVGQPLCTVHAQGPDIETVAGRLREKADAVAQLVVAGNADAA